MRPPPDLWRIPHSGHAILTFDRPSLAPVPGRS